MPLSRYCSIFPHPDDPGMVLLHSTRTTSALAVPKEMPDQIKKGCISVEEKTTLLDHGILVQSLETEQQEMLGYIDDVNRMSRALRLIVVMGLDCNLACPYCFEGTRKGKFYLSETTADDLVRFTKENTRDRNEIDVTFYGGEPLLSYDRIVSISEKLRSHADSSNVKYSFSMITNGTLLTHTRVRNLKALGLRSANVTLDGPRRIHDKSRPFTSGAGSFDTIVRNLEQAADLIKIHILGNFTRANYREFPELLDLLPGSGLGPDRVASIGFYPVFQETSGIAPDFHEGCTSTDEPWMAEAGAFLREEIFSRGFRTDDIGPSVCMIERPDHLVVNWNGGLYKCPGFIGREEFRAGTLRSGTGDYAGAYGVGNWKNKDCLECGYLPICFGGCRYLKLIRDGSISGVDCKKAYFDRTLEALVLQEVKYRAS